MMLRIDTSACLKTLETRLSQIRRFAIIFVLRSAGTVDAADCPAALHLQRSLLGI